MTSEVVVNFGASKAAEDKVKSLRKEGAAKEIVRGSGMYF